MINHPRCRVRRHSICLFGIEDRQVEHRIAIFLLTTILLTFCFFPIEYRARTEWNIGNRRCGVRTNVVLALGCGADDSQAVGHGHH